MRIAEFKKLLRQRGIEGALFFVREEIEPNFVYFTGLNITNAVLVIPADGAPVIFVSALDFIKRGNVVLVKGSILDAVKRRFSFDVVGIDFNNISVNLAEKVEDKMGARLIDISSIVSALRSVKTPKELTLMRKAAMISNQAFESVLDYFDYSKEEQIQAELEYEMKRLGGDAAFQTIVASGKNAAVPHHISGGKLQKGFCVIDFGALYKGYRSDCTRTIFIGKPSLSQKRVYSAVVRAQDKGLSAVKSGIVAGNVDAASRNALGKYKRYLTHSVGHGIGVQVHEAPYVGPGSSDKLRKGMVITVEPGVYVPGKFGIRIEDTVVVGGKVLTGLGKELVVID
jgi:Xaa-Pro aminopeptidase